MLRLHLALLGVDGENEFACASAGQSLWQRIDVGDDLQLRGRLVGEVRKHHVVHQRQPQPRSGTNEDEGYY